MIADGWVDEGWLVGVWDDGWVDEGCWLDGVEGWVDGWVVDGVEVGVRVAVEPCFDA